MEPVEGSAKCDEHGNRVSQMAKVHTIASDDSLLSPPPSMSYGGSEISFPSQTPGKRVGSLQLTMNYSEGSLLGLPPSALPQDPFSTPRASAGIIARKYIQSEENVS